MKGKMVFATTGLALILGAGNALADEDDTITLMEHLEDKLPAAIVNDVALPEPAISGDEEDPTPAEEHGGAGIAKANDAPNRRDEGIATADEASMHGFEMREAAQENIENFGRSEEFRPDPPETPEPMDPPVPTPPGG